MTANDLADWCAKAKKGERRVYWTGDVSHDRYAHPKMDADKKQRAEDCAEIASFAWRLYGRGAVALMRKRVKTNTFDYIAEKR